MDVATYQQSQHACRDVGLAGGRQRNHSGCIQRRRKPYRAPLKDTSLLEAVSLREINLDREFGSISFDRPMAKRKPCRSPA
jgi:hypothetical protein